MAFKPSNCPINVDLDLSGELGDVVLDFNDSEILPFCHPELGTIYKHFLLVGGVATDVGFIDCDLNPVNVDPDDLTPGYCDATKNYEIQCSQKCVVEDGVNVGEVVVYTILDLANNSVVGSSYYTFSSITSSLIPFAGDPATLEDCVCSEMEPTPPRFDTSKEVKCDAEGNKVAVYTTVDLETGDVVSQTYYAVGEDCSLILIGDPEGLILESCEVSVEEEPPRFITQCIKRCVVVDGVNTEEVTTYTTLDLMAGVVVATSHFTTSSLTDSIIPWDGDPEILSDCACSEQEIIPVKDYELICQDGLYTLVTIETIEGEQQEPVYTPTDQECETIPDDFEPARICDSETGTIHLVWSAVDEDGNITEILDVDTLEDCHKNCGNAQCVKWSSVVVQIDNTGTLFSEAITFNIENTDGSVDSFVSGPHAGWSDQVADIAAQMDALQTGSYDPRCTFLPNGCGGLLPPPADAPAQPGIYARYINGVHCPTDLKIPVKATATRESGKVVVLPFYVIETPEKRGWICPDCCEGEAPVLLDENMQPVPAADLPVCYFSCAEEIPEAPLSECQFDTIAGNWCDVAASGDPEVDDEIIESEIIVTVSNCDGEQTVSYSIIVDDALEEYVPVGSIVDCETGEEPFIEPPECPEGAVFECVEVPANGYGILDNSNWNDAPGVHLQNSKDYEITLTKADGTTIVVGPLANPYFNTFRTAVEAVSDCKVVPVCANHTSPKGCNAVQVANLANYPAYDAPSAPGDIQNNIANPDVSELWASGWLIDCPGCESPIVRAEITASSDAAWVGAYKDIIVHEGEATQYQRSVNCDGVFWKDCNGASIVEPAGACCASPCTVKVETALDCAIVECESDEKVCDTILQFTTGRPLPTVPWTMENSQTGATLASGATFQDFVADLESQGYETFIAGPDGVGGGEFHFMCPCPDDAIDAPAGTVFITADGDTLAKPECIPNPNFDADSVEASEDCALQTIGKNDDRRDDLLEEIAEKGASCDTPIYTKECPPDPCPPESAEVYCDGDGTQYVVVENLLSACGPTGTFEAQDYYSDPQILTAYTPTSDTDQICDDAAIKSQKCVIDECGDRWTCIEYVTVVNGTAVSSETCVPYVTNPDCEEGELVPVKGREASKEVAETKEASRLVKSLSAVKSIKLSVATINPVIPPRDVRKFPIGETCDCPCGESEAFDPNTVPCLECNVFPYEAGQIFESPIVSTIGGAGAPVDLENGPFNTITDFANELENLGYSVTVGATTFEVCGNTDDPMIGYQLQDGTTILPSGTSSLDGLLVCDPNQAATNNLLAQLIAKQCKTNDLLEQLVDCLCGDCDDSEGCPAPTLTSANGTVGDGTSADGWNFQPEASSLNDANIGGSDASFPFGTQNATSTWGEVETTVTVDKGELSEACNADPKNTIVCFELSFLQSVDGQGHRLHRWTTTAGSFVSDTNNGEINTFPNATVSVGEGLPSPLTTTNVPRAVKLEVPLSDAISGFGLSTFALGGQSANGAFDGVAIDEQITDVKFELTDILVNGESCC